MSSPPHCLHPPPRWEGMAFASPRQCLPGESQMRPPQYLLQVQVWIQTIGSLCHDGRPANASEYPPNESSFLNIVCIGHKHPSAFF